MREVSEWYLNYFPNCLLTKQIPEYTAKMLLIVGMTLTGSYLGDP